MSRSPRFGYQARRPTPSPRELRLQWVAAVELAGHLACVAKGDGMAPAFGQNLVRLAVALRDLEGANFPAPASSAQCMARAFLVLAREFADPRQGPEARTACAAFLIAGAEALDAMLSDLRTREAETWRAHTGERD
jgi:hypothetical protein